YQYADGDPLTGTDPSGHGWWSSLKAKASSAYNAVSSYTSQAASWAGSYVSYAYHAVRTTYYAATAAVLSGVSYVAKKTGFRRVAKWAEHNRKRATHQARSERRKA